jgi:2,4-dienoyl-CoA reductase-like NADH-dependent reductase (Old Yellow Enzyme family)
MSMLFEKTTLKGLELKNRFVRSATWEGLAEADGTCTPALEDLVADLAQGEVGLIISSHAFVTRQGQATPCQLGIDTDARVAPLARMVAAAHAQGGKIVAQLAHAGRLTSRELTGLPPLFLSPSAGKAPGEYHLATTEDLHQLPGAFAAAARRALEAGFDGVQLHAAHGYLLSQSLSPAFNKRDDEYGGSPANRARLLLASVAAVRQAVGNDYPLLVKLNSEDALDDGLVPDTALAVGRLLQAAGVDAIEVSGGTLLSGDLSPSRQKINTEAKEAYFRAAARQFKAALDIPIILVGGIRSPQLAERLLAGGVADYFSMARPLIREPHLIKRWAAGDLRPSTCLSDNLCNKAAREGQGLHCVVERRLKVEG